jgi:hypothetical protein
MLRFSALSPFSRIDPKYNTKGNPLCYTIKRTREVFIEQQRARQLSESDHTEQLR